MSREAYGIIIETTWFFKYYYLEFILLKKNYLMLNKSAPSVNCNDYVFLEKIPLYSGEREKIDIICHQNS